jgi:hypothetical protein
MRRTNGGEYEFLRMIQQMPWAGNSLSPVFSLERTHYTCETNEVK